MSEINIKKLVKFPLAFDADNLQIDEADCRTLLDIDNYDYKDAINVLDIGTWITETLNNAAAKDEENKSLEFTADKYKARAEQLESAIRDALKNTDDDYVIYSLKPALENWEAK